MAKPEPGIDSFNTVNENVATDNQPLVVHSVNDSIKCYTVYLGRSIGGVFYDKIKANGYTFRRNSSAMLIFASLFSRVSSKLII